MSASLAAVLPGTGILDLLTANPVVGEKREGTKRFWTVRELKILAEAYPTGGVLACLQQLPGRTAKAIYARASIEGLHAPSGASVWPRQRWRTSDAIDAVIRRSYPIVPDKAAVGRLAKALGRPRWWVTKRARQLGVNVPRVKEAPWTEAEIDLVTEHAHRSSDVLRRMLARRGFKRSATAITVKLKRLGAERADPERLTGNGLSILMGVDRKTIARWIAQGLLKATWHPAGKDDAQGGEHWSVRRSDVRRFVVEHPTGFDLRKVDQLWFIDLMAERTVKPTAAIGRAA